MAEGPLGFPRVSDIGPFVTEDVDWVLTHEVFHQLWEDVKNSEHLNFGPEPPVLVVAEMDYGFEDDSMNEMLFTRIPDKEYEESIWWENIPNRFTIDESEVTLGRITDSDYEDLHPNEIKFQSQIYTNTGGMVTFDFYQRRDKPVNGMIRVPATEQMLPEVKRAAQGLPHVEHTVLQRRGTSEQFSEYESSREDFLHPHYSIDDLKTKAEMKKVLNMMVEIAEEYDRQAKE